MCRGAYFVGPKARARVKSYGCVKQIAWGRACAHLWSSKRRCTGVIPGNHTLQQSRYRAIEHQQPALIPVGEATSGLTCKGWAYIACSDAARPVSGACTPGMPATAGAFNQRAQPPQKEAVQPGALIIRGADQMLRRASSRVHDFDLSHAHGIVFRTASDANTLRSQRDTW